MRTIATVALLAVALFAVAHVALADDDDRTCNSAATCGDHYLARQFSGLDCPTSTVNVTYTMLFPSVANQTTCITGTNSSTRGTCNRSTKRYIYDIYSGTNTCASSRLAQTVNYPTGVCLNNDDSSSPTSVVYFCNFADTPGYTSTGHTALQTNQVPTSPTCTLNSTSVSSGCDNYAYVQTFTGATCQGTASYSVASDFGAPLLDRCYFDRQSAISVNVKSTCSSSSVVETVYSNGCVASAFAYSSTYPVGVCIPSNDGTTSKIYGCPHAAASTVSISAFAIFFAVAALALIGF